MPPNVFLSHALQKSMWFLFDIQCYVQPHKFRIALCYFDGYVLTMSCKFYDFIFRHAVNHASYTQTEYGGFIFTVHSGRERQG